MRFTSIYSLTCFIEWLRDMGYTISLTPFDIKSLFAKNDYISNYIMYFKKSIKHKEINAGYTVCYRMIFVNKKGIIKEITLWKE